MYIDTWSESDLFGGSCYSEKRAATPTRLSKATMKNESPFPSPYPLLSSIEDGE
jgi:hypothetical protein